MAGTCYRRSVWQVHVTGGLCGRYMVEVLAGKSGDSEVKLSARHYETVYLASQTGAAKAERQALQFNSVVSNEIQVGLSLSCLLYTSDAADE